jgi:hypothetical protein
VFVLLKRVMRVFRISSVSSRSRSGEGFHVKLFGSTGSPAGFIEVLLIYSSIKTYKQYSGSAMIADRFVRINHLSFLPVVSGLEQWAVSGGQWPAVAR